MVKLNSKHLMFLIVGVATVALKTYPTLLIRDAGKDTWIAVTLACVLTFFSLWFVLHAASITGNYVLPEAFEKAYGPWPGRIMTGFFLFCLLLTLFESSAVEANALHTNFIVNTPVWIFLLMSVGASVYVVSKGSPAVVTTSILSLTMISLSGTLLAVLTQKYKDFRLLLPILENGVTPGLLTATLRAWGALGCVFALFPYLSGISVKRRITLHSLLAMLFVIQIQIVSILGVLSTFTVPYAKELIYPKLTQTQLVSYFEFMEAGELFVMLQMVAGWFMRFCIIFFSLLDMLRRLFASAPKLLFKILPYPLALLAYLVSGFVGSNLNRLFHSLDVLLYLQLFGFVILPLTTYSVLLARVRRKKKANGNSQNAAPSSAPSSDDSDGEAAPVEAPI